MDVDLIFKRGMAYTLAAAAIVGAYFTVVAAIAETVHTRVPSSGPYGLVVAVVVTALLFDPVRKWIQEKLDQFFFRTGYDYRRTLIEFGRELSSETDLDKMLSSLVDRLARTLLVDRHRGLPRQQRLVALRAVEIVRHRARHRARPVVSRKTANRGCRRSPILCC